MSFYDYEYFCGANIYVTIEDQPLLEAAGISYSEQDSMQPIYGYASRLFDAVAPGQKIIQGTIVVNQVDPDYLFLSATRGRANIEPEPLAVPESSVASRNADALRENSVSVGDLWREDSTSLNTLGYGSPFVTGEGTPGEGFSAVTSQLETQYWGSDTVSAAEDFNQIRMTDPSLMGPTNIKIEFANEFGIMLHSCFFVGRSSGIQIDENVILEEFTFFARASSTFDL